MPQQSTGIIRGGDALKITLDQADGSTTTLQITDTGSMQEVVDKINDQGAGLIKATLSDDGKMSLRSDTGATITRYCTGDAVTVKQLLLVSQLLLYHQAQLSFEITDPNVSNVDIEYR